MVTDVILDLGSQLLAFLIGLVPDVSPPGWLTSAIGTMTGLFSNLGLLGHWFPVWLLGPAVGLVLVCMSAGFFIKVGRSAMSLFTGGGGAAG